jgi:hypothetical protein
MSGSDYFDDGDHRIYRHRPEPVRAFEIVVNIGDRVRDLVLVTPNGCHEISVDVRAHCNGVMRTVIQLRGDAMADGALRVVVKNQEIG